MDPSPPPRAHALHALHAARHGLRAGLLFIGAVLFLFEEWLWIGFLRLFGWMGRLGLLRWLDARLARLGPVAALVILCIPMVLLFPVKIAGLWMIASGRFLGGCVVMLVAKLASTAVIARIFITCRPQLLRMAWFARLHAVTCALRIRIHEALARQPAWIGARRLFRRLRRALPMGVHARHGTLHRWRSRRSKHRGSAAATDATELRPAPLDDRLR